MFNLKALSILKNTNAQTAINYQLSIIQFLRLSWFKKSKLPSP